MLYSDTFDGYDKICRQGFDKIASDGLEIDHTWSRRGTQAVQYKSCDLLNTLETVQNVLDAQEKGFDGVIIGCSLDIGLKESREMATIPVVSSMEAAMYASCIMGRRFSIISFGERARARQEQLIEEYGLRSRSTSVRTFEMSLEQLGRCLDEDTGQQASSAEETESDTEIVGCAMKSDKTRLREIFMEEAKKAVTQEGAEVIIPGCGILSALCVIDEIANIDGIEDVPVIDTFVPALKMVEMLVTMKDKLGVNISKRGIYESPAQEVIELIKNM
jgi:allantoin racemase